ncbi:MAG: serine protease [Pirellulales bacterium]
MGAKVGTTVEVTIGGEQLEDADDLVFSDPRITATRKLNAAGQPEQNKYVVTIAPDCPTGILEARVMTRLGISTSRAFCVGTRDEVLQSQANTSLATAIDLPLNSVCNGVMTARSVDFYRFEARQGQRIIVDCASRGIDSKLDATVIIADEQGRDLLAERRGGALDFAVPSDGKYVIKLHDLTFRGGPAFYYRLGLWELRPGEPLVRQPSTRKVNAFSWPPHGLPIQPTVAEVEPNNDGAQSQRISLPCDLAGSFYPAADVDFFEFEAHAGEVWWVEVASERLGLPTDPVVVVQRIASSDKGTELTDVAEFGDIPSPVKVSSNGYAYDGPPYNAGTSDVLGKLEIKQDGLYRLQIRDLFGGTRSDPRNVYRMIIRKAAPDFALVAWALHMELRNGDRNAVSKPLALRGGATMALEVIAMRRDGFDGEIELAMDGLPQGLTATGLKIPAGQSRGFMLVSAAADAPRAMSSASFVGRSAIDGETVTRRCYLASHAWPITDSWGEIPSPRLLGDVPVSVSGLEFAPLTLSPPAEPLTVVAGEKLTVPLKHSRRSTFSGGVASLRGLGAGFERVAADVALTADASQVIIDTAALKTAPGEYKLAFHGGAVIKYRHRLDLVESAEASQKRALTELAAIEAELKQLTENVQASSDDAKPTAQQAVEAAQVRQKAAAAAVAVAAETLKRATANANPQEIVDIVVSEPLTVRVLPAENK